MESNETVRTMTYRVHGTVGPKKYRIKVIRCRLHQPLITNRVFVKHTKALERNELVYEENSVRIEYSSRVSKSTV